ncbi:MAG TPA: tRNA-uridine aminocarboxypropyltransferase [Burkholderiaceae bacterium]|jgi:DTW domain-containing protein YfiP
MPSSPVLSSSRLCPRCERAACLCALLPTPPLAHDVDVLILQDPLERLQAKGTAPLLRLGLQSCEVRTGEQFEPSALRSGRHDLLLYPPDPGAPAQTLDPLPAPAHLRLIVLDGTWRKSRKLLYQNPWLATLPRVALDAAVSARYGAVRKAQRSGQLSTLEATLLALERLEGPRFASLWESFEAFIASHALTQTK